MSYFPNIFIKWHCLVWLSLSLFFVFGTKKVHINTPLAEYNQLHTVIDILALISSEWIFVSSVVYPYQLFLPCQLFLPSLPSPTSVFHLTRQTSPQCWMLPKNKENSAFKTWTFIPSSYFSGSAAFTQKLNLVHKWCDRCVTTGFCLILGRFVIHRHAFKLWALL